MRRVNRLIQLVAQTGVNEQGCSHPLLAIRTVNVAEDVHARLYFLHALQQQLTACRLAFPKRQIQDSKRRPVSYQHICVVRYETPVMSERMAVARMVEGPIIEPRLMGRAPELQAPDFYSAIFQIDDVLQRVISACVS